MNPLQQCSNSSNSSPNSCSRSTSAHTAHGISQELVSKFQSFRGVSERGGYPKGWDGGVGAVLVFAKPFQIVQIVQICRTCFFPRSPPSWPVLGLVGSALRGSLTYILGKPPSHVRPPGTSSVSLIPPPSLSSPLSQSTPPHLPRGR